MSSEESGIGYRKMYLILTSFAGFLPLPLVGYGVSLIFTASLRSSKNGSLAITLPRTFLLFYSRLLFIAVQE